MGIQRIKPAKQGELDGACGFYAITNAIHLLEPDLNKEQVFSSTFRGFIQDGNPMAFIEGTRRGSIKNALSRVLEDLHSNFDFTDNHTEEAYKFKLSIPYWRDDKERTRASVIEQLKSANYSKGIVCLLGYENQQHGYAHWTVVKQVKNDHLFTHDSSGEIKKIPLDLVRVDSSQKSNKARPFNIWSDHLMVLSRVKA